MPATEAAFSARSWLFAPGDSDRKTEKAAASAADVVLLDLEDAVTEDAKPKARAMISAFLEAQPPPARRRLWVRINPLDRPHALADLAAVVPARPGGIMLPKSRGRADVELLDHYLSALEVSAGLERGATRVIALATETAESMFTVGNYRGAPRLAAMSWGAEDLADAVGASENRNPDGSYGFTYELARSLCLLGAAAAGVAAIDTIHGDFRDEPACASGPSRSDGRGSAACSPSTPPSSRSSTPPSPPPPRSWPRPRKSSTCSPPTPASAPSAAAARCSTARTSPAPRLSSPQDQLVKPNQTHFPERSRASLSSPHRPPAAQRPGSAEPEPPRAPMTV